MSRVTWTRGIDAWALLHDAGRSIPALLVVNASTLELLNTTAQGHEDDEYLTRPYSAESIRWRIEAMCIRSVAVDDGSGPVLQTSIDSADWSRRGRLIAVFNPKGGVGKTTVATNLSAALVAKGQRVLLLDADTVTGHVTTSLGMEGCPDRRRRVAGRARRRDRRAPSTSSRPSHTSGLKILALSSSPIHTEILDPQRVARCDHRRATQRRTS